MRMPACSLPRAMAAYQVSTSYDNANERLVMRVVYVDKRCYAFLSRSNHVVNDARYCCARYTQAPHRRMLSPSVRGSGSCSSSALPDSRHSVHKRRDGYAEKARVLAYAALVCTQRACPASLVRKCVRPTRPGAVHHAALCIANTRAHAPRVWRRRAGSACRPTIACETPRVSVRVLYRQRVCAAPARAHWCPSAVQAIILALSFVGNAYACVLSVAFYSAAMRESSGYDIFHR